MAMVGASGLVTVERDDAVAVVRLNRPEARNAINPAMADAMRAALETVRGDASVRAIVLTGSPPVFCAGMDLRAYADGQGDAILFGPGRFAGFVDAAIDVPVIAAIEGTALAGGCEIALACDIVVAARDARFGLPEVKLGIFPVAGGAFRLPRRISPGRAIEMILTGDPISAEDALRLTLVDHLTEPGGALERARGIAHRIATNAPLAVAAALRVARASYRAADGRNWEKSEHEWVQVDQSCDACEGVDAFLTRRSPEWTAR